MNSPQTLRTPPPGFAAHRARGGKPIQLPTLLCYDPLVALSKLEFEIRHKPLSSPFKLTTTTTTACSPLFPRNYTCVVISPATASSTQELVYSPCSPTSQPILRLQTQNLTSSFTKRRRTTSINSSLKVTTKKISDLEHSFIFFEDSPLEHDTFSNRSATTTTCLQQPSYQYSPIPVTMMIGLHELSYLDFSDEISNS